MLKLYDYELSGNCYKVRQLLAWLGVEAKHIPVDFHPGREHKSPRFLRDVNAAGQIPVIDDGGFILRDAQAILVYLCAKFDISNRWHPAQPRLRGEVALWLTIAEDITRTASAARLHDALGYPCDIESCRSGAYRVFESMEDHLSARGSGAWLVGSSPTIADLACFPYVALAGEGGVSLDAYPALRSWVWNFRYLPGFIGMAGILKPERDLGAVPVRSSAIGPSNTTESS